MDLFLLKMKKRRRPILVERMVLVMLVMEMMKMMKKKSMLNQKMGKYPNPQSNYTIIFQNSISLLWKACGNICTLILELRYNGKSFGADVEA